VLLLLIIWCSLAAEAVVLEYLLMVLVVEAVVLVDIEQVLDFR
jgi:hypothetical protein